MITAEKAQKKVATLSRELDHRREEISKRIGYVKGETGKLKYASEKFQEYNAGKFAGLSDNWCAPVASAPAERMSFLGLRPYEMERGVDKELQRTWETVDGDAGSAEALFMFTSTGRAFSLVHPAEDGPDYEPSLTWEHPESAIVETDPVTRKDRYGLVTWIDGTDDFATLYTPDQVWRFTRPMEQEKWERASHAVQLTDGWVARDDGPQDNPLGEVPLTEMRNQSLLDDEPLSDISGVMAMQDAINLIWAYLVNGLDSASLPMRVVTGSDLPKVPKLDKRGKVVGYEDIPLDELIKEKILFLSKEGARVHEWQAANLQVFWEVIERAIEHIAAQTRTPPHYLIAKIVNSSGDALNIAEAGLVSKVQERITYANPGMKKTQRLLAKAKGADEKRISRINAGKNIWADVQYRSDSQRADAMGKLRAAGMPMQWIVEQLVTEPSEVDRVMDMIRAERREDPLQVAQEAIRAGI